jgi:hypothetical protein
MKLEVTIERTIQGAWRISAIVNGYLMTRQYFFYTKGEAIREFKKEVQRGGT